MAPDSCVICAQCHRVWEINNNGELEICQYQFEDWRKLEIISSLDGVNRAFKAAPHKTSILDLMVEP